VNAIAVESSSWSNRRWCWLVLLVFALQLVLIVYLSEKGGVRTPAPFKTSIRLVDRRSIDTETAELFAIRDPTLFVLANPRGFSGSAWLRVEPFPYSLTNRTAAPQWLAPDTGELADEFAQFVGQTTDWPVPHSEKPRPLLSQIEIPDTGSVLQPTLRIEGDLAQRRLLSSNALPAAQPGILTNCVIQVIVLDDGRTFSATRLVSSGSAAADEQAGQFALAARFTRLNDPSGSLLSHSGRITTGTLVFEWLGTNEPRTNNRSAKR